MAWEDQTLDLGMISRMFRIELATSKLNGHFISIEVDLIASSVTWESLLAFFSSRGMSTGTHGSDALIVNSKLSKSETKRPPSPPLMTVPKALHFLSATFRFKEISLARAMCMVLVLRELW